MTTFQLKALSTKWQKLLRLHDWKINVRFATPREMQFMGSEGECDYNQKTHTADIRVRPSGSYPPYMTAKQIRTSQTDAVIHELLHCVFAPFWREVRKKKL